MIEGYIRRLYSMETRLKDASHGTTRHSTTPTNRTCVGIVLLYVGEPILNAVDLLHDAFRAPE